MTQRETMNALSKFNHIRWKYIVGMNLTVLTLAVAIASLKPTTTTTEHRSQANEVTPTPEPKPSFDPQNPPELYDADINWAKIGDAVVVKGKNLGKVPFGTLFIGKIIIPSSDIISWEPNQIVLTVPSNTIDGKITLTYSNMTGQEINLTTKKELTITTTNRL